MKKHEWGYLDTFFKKDQNSNTVYLTGDRYEICSKPINKLIDFVNSIIGLSIFDKKKI